MSGGYQGYDHTCGSHETNLLGQLTALNRIAREAGADYIVHTGDFGFNEKSSLDRITEKTLRHVVQYSPLLSMERKKALSANDASGKTLMENIKHSSDPILSELELLLSGEYRLDVPVYTVWGACEDVRVVEKFRSGEYNIPNLHLVDEHSSGLIDAGGIKLRLLGLGGAVVMHKLFDNGEGQSTIAGGQGTMWTSLLQIGELIDTATRVFDNSETRVLLTHGSPGREGLLSQLALYLRADLTISAGLHFRYASSYNDFSVLSSTELFKSKLSASRAQFFDVWDTVRGEVEPAVANNANQKKLLDLALDAFTKMPQNATAPSNAADEAVFKNLWHFNLCDAAFGSIILDILDGRVSADIKSQGFNFGYRRPSNKPNHKLNDQATSSTQSTENKKQITRPSQDQEPASSASTAAAPEALDTTASNNTNNVSSFGYGDVRKESSGEQRQPGLWVDVKDSSVDADTVATYFAEEDRANIVRKDKKNSNKTSKIYFLIYFNSRDNAMAAIDRADREYVNHIKESEYDRKPRYDRQASWRGSDSDRPRYNSIGGGFRGNRDGTFRGRGGFSRGRGRGASRNASDSSAAAGEPATVSSPAPVEE